MNAGQKKYEYSVNEVPPLAHLLLSGFQHVLIMVVAIGIPVIFAGQMNETPQFTATLIFKKSTLGGILREFPDGLMVLLPKAHP